MKRPRSHAHTALRGSALVAAAALAAAWAQRAPAAPATCSVSVDGAIQFGLYDPLSPTALDSTGVITLDGCAPGQVTIAIGAGQSGTFAARELRASGGDVLRYNLYLEAGRATVWGDGSAGTSVWPTPSSGRGKQATVYARVPAGQSVSEGAYSDTITVTVNY